MSFRIRNRPLLIVLVAVGQLAVLLPGSLWLAGWIDHAVRDAAEDRFHTAATRHTRQMADLILDLSLSDLKTGTDDRQRLQQLIDRMGRPYGASLVVIRQADGRVLAQPRELGLFSLKPSVLSANGDSESGVPIAVYPLDPLGLTLVALPHRGDVGSLVQRLSAYVRWTVVALLIVIVMATTVLTSLIVDRYENRLAGINTDLRLERTGLQAHTISLEKIIADRTREVRSSRDAVVFGLAMLAEWRDGEMGEHLNRIQDYVAILGGELIKNHPEVDDEFVATIVATSPLHDIGKVAVPDSVLRKPEELTDEQRKEIERHTWIGGETLLAVKRKWGHSDFLVTACEVCFAHHERWNGTGYPYGLAGDMIPLAARVVALADVYDALTTERVYKDALPHDHAREYIIRESGGHFDPAIVEAFLNREADFRAVAESERDRP